MSRSPRPFTPLQLGTLTLALAASAAQAQMHHVEAPERVTRAVGVYEWTGDLAKPTAARFVPVSLFIEGRFEDAGVYLARPTPFALQPGIVYAIERAGEPQGLFDLESVRRVVTPKAIADDYPEGAWYAFGKFTAETTPAVPRLHPTGHLSTIQSSGSPSAPTSKDKGAAAPDADSSRPHMSRRSPATDAPSADSRPPAGDSGGSGQTSTGATPDSSGSSAPDAKPGSTTTTDTSDDTDRPTLRHRDPSQDAARRREYGTRSKTASVTAAGPALGDDPDRPTLSHNNAAETETPELTGLPADMRQAVAVSDAAHRDAHPFARAWDSPAERAQTLAAMEALARPRLANYLAANDLLPSDAPVVEVAAGQAPSITPPAATAPAPAETAAPPRLQRGVPQEYKGPSATSAAASAPLQPSAKTTPAHTAARRSPRGPAARPSSLGLSHEEISGFTLSYGGLPTFVYTAASATSPAKTSPSAASAAHPIAYVTVVAQRLPSGEFQLSLASVTDSTHLDRTPRLRLIDAVDPDDSHRASLVFELRGATGRQFALYRLTSAHAEQTFTTASLE